MEVTFRKRERGGIEFGIIYGLIALLALVAARFLPVLAVAPSCPFKALTGLPCPTCGSTRSIVHLAHGDFTAALAMNPLICMLCTVAFLGLFYGILAKVTELPGFRIALSDREKNAFRVVAVLILLSNWMYLFFVL
ncbi:MAG TPA: DUF2752 domain-containing protein [Nitrospirota bacterium]|nr:DUF2752 domain-containing protein [Nitrospirota bacterium]